MSSSRRPTRSSSPGLVNTAGALVALVAVAALMTSTAAATPVRTSGEARQTTIEGAKVRAAVAAVAAAARTLIDGDRLMHAMPADWTDDLRIVEVAGAVVRESPLSESSITILPESLLDLPPPVG